MRWITNERLLNVHRRHLDAQNRDAGQEVSLYCHATPAASSFSIAQHLLANLTSPSQAAVREELRKIVQRVLNEMDPLDREILVLRNFEELTTSETAEVLGMKRSTAGKRYISALKRLRQSLEGVPGMEHFFQ